MLSRLRPRSVYDVMAAIACFAALGGTAYAANTIYSTDIVDGEVKAVDIATSAVTTSKIYNGSVTNPDLAATAVTGAKVVDNSLTGSDIDESTLGTVGYSDYSGYAYNAGYASSAGSAPAAGIETVYSALATNGANSQNFASIACPSGKTATGGGLFGSAGTAQSINSSYPYGNGWAGYMNNNSATATTFRAYAICATVPASFSASLHKEASKDASK